MSDIVIYGRGKTGKSLYKLLLRQGKQAVFYDDVNGFDSGGAFTCESLVLLSPGVKPNSKGLVEAREVGAKLVSELEYCYPLCSGKIVSVTGTNGKTTTCEMISYLLRRASIDCRLLGNGGVPLSLEVLDISANEIVVLESSSFQLADAQSFAPYISVFTSLACDHLDYHASFEEYVLAKVNNFERIVNGYALFNADDENVMELSCKCQCKRLYYSASGNARSDCYFDGRNVVINFDGKQFQTECSFLANYAKHNLSNALGAILAAYLLGVSLDTSASALVDYRLLPHRMEIVDTICGVTFVDDSKATNVHATVNALQNYKQPLALILGGSDKGERFDGIFATLQDNVVVVAASGETANAIVNCGARYGIDVLAFDDIKDATEFCYKRIKACGEGVVLMSNACASFDKFSGYAERGQYFQQAVKGLSGDKKTD